MFYRMDYNTGRPKKWNSLSPAFHLTLLLGRPAGSWSRRWVRLLWISEMTHVTAITEVGIAENEGIFMNV